MRRRSVYTTGHRSTTGEGNMGERCTGEVSRSEWITATMSMNWALGSIYAWSCRYCATAACQHASVSVHWRYYGTLSEQKGWVV